MSRTNTSLKFVAAAALFAALGTPAAFADSAGATVSQGDKFSEETGEALYSNVCQACHMEEGKGAIGAGKYPPLAKNENLESAGYPIFVILHGQKGMPAVGQMMSDEQVAAVVNYIRTNFGNDYKDEVTAQDVADTR
ncbi:c-type cytochrome [Pseudaminobacter arsenicus]|uniref:C-type cytochrome n=1 Tax=Borborobacter arsenicus TaxID=1851146 RepID=A0A432VBY0_9HYPH|nr:cytochrome c [Pseudaminobacter arsenicus]RUM99636.1 c-type cytochrome [Pseudaminobacter arsenicus]